MTEQEKQIGQAALAIMDHGGPHTTNMEAVTSKLKDQGIVDSPGRVYHFLEQLNLITMMPAGEGMHITLGRITFEGTQAMRRGLPNYLADRDAKEEAKHQASLSAIRTAKWNRIGIAANALFAVINILVAIYNAWLRMQGHL